MKILCVADQIDPMIYNANAKKTFSDIDLILCAGDLPMDYIDFIITTLNKPAYFVFGNHDLKEYKFYHGGAGGTLMGFNGSSATERKTGNAISEMNGASHGATYAGFKTFTNKSLSFRDKKTGRFTPLLIAGASGSMRYNSGLCQFTDREMMFRLILMAPKLLLNKLRYGRFLDIFLTHATPEGIHDQKDPCHKGFNAFNWFLKKFKPSYMVHGHIHIYDQREERMGKYYETMIVNAFDHSIIEL